MKEHPIIFNSEMVRAILDGSKTQTRRVIKDPCRGRKPARRSSLSITGGIYSIADTEAELRLTKNKPPNFPCPFGVPGDHLWVREKFTNINKEGVEPEYYYFADTKDAEDYDPTEWKWKPSIHMPRWASRITFEVLNIRVERVQDISEEDAINEGVDAITVADHPRQATLSRRADFKQLWDSINAKKGYGWNTDCWVWVVDFKLL